MKSFVLVASLSVMAMPALAETPRSDANGSGSEPAAAAAQPPEASGETAEAERKICRRVNMASGSRMSLERLCMTASQWREYNRDR